MGFDKILSNELQAELLDLVKLKQTNITANSKVAAPALAFA